MRTSLAIIGAGPGGEAAAKRAAKRGIKTVLIEKADLGGVCLNRGCIPSKILLEAGRLLSQAKAASAHLSGAESLSIRWEALQKRKSQIVNDLRVGLTQHLSRLGVDVFTGTARFSGPNQLIVAMPNGEQTVEFEHAILAAGSEAFFPPPFDSIRDIILDSDRALALDHVPARLVVVGGGAVGCEFACLFQELGSRVTLVEMKDQLLPGEDVPVVRVLQNAFEKRGMTVLTSTTVEFLSKTKHWTLRLSNRQEIEADEVLVCVGRRPNAAGLALDKASVKVDKNRVAVNEFLQTSQPHIYAVGDVNGLSLLAHAASAQAETAVDHIAGEKKPYDNSLVPRALYTWPEVASVGEWTSSAQAKGKEAKSQRFFFKGSAKALAGNETDGFIQIVFDTANNKLLGAQIAGPHATELIHVFSTALVAGFTVDQLRRVIFAHPTLSEGIKEALSR